MVPLVIHLIRHADSPCGLAPLDALVGGDFPVLRCFLSGLHVHINYDSLGYSSRRLAIAFT